MEGRPHREGRPQTAAEIRDNLIGHARGDLNILLGENYYTEHLDSYDVNLRAKFIEIVEREIEALGNVDTEDTSAEEVRVIDMSFREERYELEKEVLGR